MHSLKREKKGGEYKIDRTREFDFSFHLYVSRRGGKIEKEE